MRSKSGMPATLGRSSRGDGRFLTVGSTLRGPIARTSLGFDGASVGGVEGLARWIGTVLSSDAGSRRDSGARDGESFGRRSSGMREGVSRVLGARDGASFVRRSSGTRDGESIVRRASGTRDGESIV